MLSYMQGINVLSCRKVKTWIASPAMTTDSSGWRKAAIATSIKKIFSERSGTDIFVGSFCILHCYTSRGRPLNNTINIHGSGGSTDSLRRAWTAFAAGRISEAELPCRLALGADKKNFDALHLMGLIELQRGHLDAAEQMVRQALRSKAHSAAALCNLSLILQHQDRYEEALINLDKALRIEPRHVTTLNNKGHILWRLKRSEEALDFLNRALTIEPKHADALCNRGNVLTDLKRFEEALRDYDAALKISARDAIVINNRANVLWALDRRDEALRAYETAFAISSKDLSILKDYGSALLFSDREADALRCFESALERKPDDIYFTYKRGTALAKLDRFEEALTCFDRALEFEAENVDALNGRGNVLSALSRAAEAIASYDRALQIAPETPESHWNRSLTLLRQGHFDEGWREYEWRWKTANFTTKPRDFEEPLWLGEEPIVGKTILLHAEQGFGDTIQFGRYIPLVAKLGAKIIVEVQPPLKSIFSNIEGAAAVIGAGEDVPAFDVHCPLLSLPFALKTQIDTIPGDVPYLTADPARASKFGSLVRSNGERLIGLAWAGRPTFGGDKTRSIGLERMTSMLSVPGIRFVAIQKDLRPGDSEILAKFPNVDWVGDQLTDFGDTAGLMSGLDLVISSDTSVVHLAGALERPVWVLLEHTPDWRWLLDRGDCPWYPTARLFRQPNPGDWESVISAVVSELLAIQVS
jgi:tetratricopeptide (TPR) repeat protein